MVLGSDSTPDWSFGADGGEWGGDDFALYPDNEAEDDS